MAHLPQKASFWQVKASWILLFLEYPDKSHDDPGEVDSSFFCEGATVLSPHTKFLILTQRMHKPI